MIDRFVALYGPKISRAKAVKICGGCSLPGMGVEGYYSNAKGQVTQVTNISGDFYSRELPRKEVPSTIKL